MRPNPFPNLSNSIDRKEALKLCIDFYQIFYFPDIEIDELKGITWEDISQLYDPKSAISQTLSDFPELADILKYIRLSHNSYLQLIKEDNGLHSLDEYISFQEYDELSENAREYLKNKFNHMPVLDFYSDSVSTPTAICYPLQYLNIFFNKDSFCFLEEKKMADFNWTSLSSRKILSNILEEHKLTDFKTNILQKNIPGSKTKYFIPKCSIISLTFVLLASNSKEIPIEFYYEILSDFVINICVANNCKPYEILIYLSKVKQGFPKEDLIHSRHKFFCSYEEKIRQAASKTIKSSYDDKHRNHHTRDEKIISDNINLFWEFSTEFFQLVEKYSSLQRKMTAFREVEKDVLSDRFQTLNVQNESKQDGKSATDRIKESFLKYFDYDSRNYNPLTYSELNDFLTCNPDGTIRNLIMFSDIASLCKTDSELLWNNVLYSQFFFNHFK